MNNINKIIIYGVPGSGKTYYSENLSKELNIPVFEADKIKDELRKFKTKEESPFLYLGTCQAYQYFGELNKENVIKGLLAVRETLYQAVVDKLQSYEKIIMEAAFFNPSILKNYADKIILLTTLDEEKHQQHFFQNREKNLDMNNQFKSARIIQEYLVNEAKSLDIEIIDNYS